ncbi:hypothetical protein GOBAR_DD00443 [Gossypium barbadense]|nr:hypothetical protein GOBAR_DD00443 [Gossypium barbadense]
MEGCPWVASSGGACPGTTQLSASSSQAQASVKEMHSANSTQIEISIDNEEEDEEAPLNVLSLGMIMDREALQKFVEQAKAILGKKRASKQPNTYSKKLKTKSDLANAFSMLKPQRLIT